MLERHLAPERGQVVATMVLDDEGSFCITAQPNRWRTRRSGDSSWV
jgi:hypothetical protein